MKITINLDSEIEDALQEHLDGGTSVQNYIKAALRFFNVLRAKEDEGAYKIGYGHKDRFTTYNTEESPRDYLTGEK